MNLITQSAMKNERKSATGTKKLIRRAIRCYSAMITWWMSKTSPNTRSRIWSQAKPINWQPPRMPIRLTRHLNRHSAIELTHFVAVEAPASPQVLRFKIQPPTELEIIDNDGFRIILEPGFSDPIKEK